jgi:hypothetical protein
MQLRSFPCLVPDLYKRISSSKDGARLKRVHESARSAPNHLGVKLTWVRKQHWIGPRHRPIEYYRNRCSFFFPHRLATVGSRVPRVLHRPCSWKVLQILSPFSAGQACLLLMIVYVTDRAAITMGIQNWEKYGGRFHYQSVCDEARSQDLIFPSCEGLRVLLLAVGRGTTSTPCLRTLRQSSMDDNSNTESQPCKFGAVCRTESQRKPTSKRADTALDQRHVTDASGCWLHIFSWSTVSVAQIKA